MHTHPHKRQTSKSVTKRATTPTFIFSILTQKIDQKVLSGSNTSISLSLFISEYRRYLFVPSRSAPPLSYAHAIAERHDGPSFSLHSPPYIRPYILLPSLVDTIAHVTTYTHFIHTHSSLFSFISLSNGHSPQQWMHTSALLFLFLAPPVSQSSHHLPPPPLLTFIDQRKKATSPPLVLSNTVFYRCVFSF